MLSALAASRVKGIVTVGLTGRSGGTRRSDTRSPTWPPPVSRWKHSWNSRPRCRIAAARAQAPPKQPVLVSIFMEGGWDSLSVLAPVKEAIYHELRPTLGRNEGEGVLFSEDETLMWHPQAAGLATLHSEGKVTVFPS